MTENENKYYFYCLHIKQMTWRGFEPLRPSGLKPDVIPLNYIPNNTY